MDLDKKKKKRNNVKTLLKSAWIRVYRKKEKSRNNLISGDEGRNQNGIEKKKERSHLCTGLPCHWVNGGDK